MPLEDEALKWEKEKKELNNTIDNLLNDQSTRKPANWNSVVSAFQQEMRHLFNSVALINKYRSQQDPASQKRLNDEISSLRSSLNNLRDNLFLSVKTYAPKHLSNDLSAVLNKIESTIVSPEQKQKNIQTNDAAYSRNFLAWKDQYEKFIEASNIARETTKYATDIDKSKISIVIKQNLYLQKEIGNLVGGLEAQKAALEKNKNSLSKENYFDKSESIRNCAKELRIKYQECLERSQILKNSSQEKVEQKNINRGPGRK